MCFDFYQYNDNNNNNNSNNNIHVCVFVCACVDGNARSEKGECYEMTTLSGAGDRSADDKVDVISEDKGHGETEGMLTLSGVSKGRTFHPLCLCSARSS